MPLDTTDPAALALEVTRAEDFRRKHTTRSREIMKRYIGNWYRQDVTAEPTSENLIASYIAFMLPELSFRKPVVKVSALRPVSHKQIADFMQMGLNSWIGSSNLGEEHQDIVRDMLMGYGVAKVGIEPRDGYMESPLPNYGRLTPFVCRVPPDQLILDPGCEIPALARFVGDCYWKDLDDLINHPERWDPAQIEIVKTWAASDGSGKSTSIERAVNLGITGDRKRVMLVDLWIPETGELVTLVKGEEKADTKDMILRREKYEGPRTGPYQIFGAYRVAGDPYPISPLQYCMEQFEEMQGHINAGSEAAETFKKFVMVESSQVDLQNAVMTAKNGSVVAVRGLSAASMQQVELGGANADQLQYVAILRDRFDRVLGLGDAQRGRAAGGTATEANIVQSNVDGRTDWLIQQVITGTENVMGKVGWYLFYNPNVAISVSQVQTVTDPITGMQSQKPFEGLFIGGVQPGQEDADWLDFNLNIVVNSMKRPNQGQELAQAMQIMSLAPQAVQMMVQMPMLNVRWILNNIGEAMDIENLADLLINMMALQQFGQSEQQQAMFGGADLPGPLPGNLNPLLQQYLQGGNKPLPGGNWMNRPAAPSMAGGPQPYSVTPNQIMQPAMPTIPTPSGLVQPTMGAPGPMGGMMGMGAGGPPMGRPKQRKPAPSRVGV